MIISMKTQASSLKGYLGSRLTSVDYLSLSEKTYNVRVENLIF